MGRFSFERINAQQAEDFWQDSPHGSVFTHPQVLTRLSPDVHWWLARKGREPFCLWPVCLEQDGNIHLPGLAYYVGPMWSRAGSSIPTHRWLADSTSVYKGLARKMIEHHGAVQAQLPVRLHDVRVFDWWNYHHPEKPRFTILPRYTACIENLQKRCVENIWSDFREVRRKEIRRLQRKGLPKRTFNWKEEELIGFYCRELGGQGVSVSEPAQKLMQELIGLASQGWGQIFAFRDSVHGEIASALVSLRAKGIWNMVLNATASNWRGSGLTAWTISTGITAAKDLGDDTCDFNGANSPARGDDKHSYGARPCLFFELRYP
ncbi:MAG: GNAT family N-acetyltransferase [Desulfovermiculus sp.]